MMKTLHSALFKLSFLFFTFAFFSTAQAADPAKGEQIFQTNCTACHKLGETLIGPNLQGVKARWKDEKKLYAFIKNSQAVIQSGDTYAKGIFAEFNNVIMPPQDLNDEQIGDLLAYIDAGGTTGGGDDKVGTAPAGGGSYAPVPKNDSWMRWLLIGIIILLVIILLLSNKLFKSVFGLNVDKTDGHDNKKYHFRFNNINAIIFPIFFILWFGLMIWETGIHTTPEFMRPEAASDTGQEIDRLFNMTLIVTGIVFVVTQILLFWYAFRYRHREGRKAYFYSHNNTLEFVWTSIPAVVLAALVLYGFKTWQKATGNPDDNPLTIEAFARQFDWTFRYPGPDGKLGRTDFMKIDGASNPLGIDFTDPASKDDYLVTELHLPVNRDIYLKLRSQDVTHAAYLPHFRAQMYANPGMDTRMRFKPLLTTAEMRNKTGNKEFNYELACNQLCGAAHWNMRRLVIVELENEFQNWQKDKKPAFDKIKGQQATAVK